MSFKKSLIATAIVTAISSQAIAKIPTIIITNARYAQELDEVIGSTTVINKKAIEDSQASTVTELLQAQAGITVTSNGGNAHQTDVSLRGTNRGQTLVLVDGIRVNADNSETYWQTLDVNNIEQIEIIRGNKSSLYGSDAIGGVIQIITKKKSGYNIKVTKGSFNTQKTSLSLGVQKDDFGLSLNASKDKSDGFSRTNDKAPFGNFDPDKDFYNKDSYGINAWVNLTPSLKVTLNASNSKTLAGTDSSSFTNYDEIAYQNKVHSIKIDHEVSPNWNHSIQASKADINYYLTQKNNPSKITDNTIIKDEFHWQHNFKIAANTLSIGYDQLKEKANAKGDFSYQESIKNESFYANLSGSLNQFEYTIGAREDDHSLFGKHSTHNLGFKYHLNNDWSLHTAYSTGFRAPNITELYLPGFMGFGSGSGNNKLQPEESKSAELGLKYTGTDSIFSLVAFQTNIKNMIDDPAPAYTFINIEEAKIKGFEISANKQIGSFSIGANYTRQDVTDAQGNEINYRPKDKLSINLGKRFNKGFINLSSVFTGTQSYTHIPGWPLANEQRMLPGYGVTSLSGKYKLNKNLSLGLKIENLFDKEYESVYGYNTAERSYYLSLEHKGNW